MIVLAPTSRAIKARGADASGTFGSGKTHALFCRLQRDLRTGAAIALLGVRGVAERERDPDRCRGRNGERHAMAGSGERPGAALLRVELQVVDARGGRNPVARVAEARRALGPR